MPEQACVVLPHNVLAQNVADAAGALLGLPRRWARLPGGGRYVEVDGVRAAMTPQLGLALVTVAGARVGRPEDHALYYFEPTAAEGRMLEARSTPAWVAVFRGLADFFGGDVYYCDDHGAGPDYRRPARPREENSPQDGPAWDVYQGRLMALRPLGGPDLRRCAGLAVYPS